MFFFIPGHWASRPPRYCFLVAPLLFHIPTGPLYKKDPAPRSNLLQAPGLAGQLYILAGMTSHSKSPEPLNSA